MAKMGRGEVRILSLIGFGGAFFSGMFLAGVIKHPESSIGIAVLMIISMFLGATAQVFLTKIALGTEGKDG